MGLIFVLAHGMEGLTIAFIHAALILIHRLCGRLESSEIFTNTISRHWVYDWKQENSDRETSFYFPVEE